LRLSPTAPPPTATSPLSLHDALPISHTLSGTNTRGTTHGSPWTYDSHAPMHWYGWTVPVGRSSHPVHISDIASTVATFLNTPFPSGNTGTPMNEYMRK